jgi:hypothetical protein
LIGLRPLAFIDFGLLALFFRHAFVFLLCSPSFCFIAGLLRKIKQSKAVKQSKANLGVYLGVA